MINQLLSFSYLTFDLSTSLFKVQMFKTNFAKFQLVKLAVKNYSNMNRENFGRFQFRYADCVCFDVDSTVCRDECIDELAKLANKSKQVQEM